MSEPKCTTLSKDEINQKLVELRAKHGEWAYDIPLPHDIWTKGNLGIPHTRLKRVVQVVSDLSRRPLSECRILDLGCLDGIFSIEFALQGASTVGVEIREANIQKAIFCRDALGLANLEFRQDDARNVSVKTYGTFDAIICSGLLYHLTAKDAVDLIHALYAVTSRVVVIDTHIALEAKEKVVVKDKEYWGQTYKEFESTSTMDQIAKFLWSSADNPTSFWFTKASLLNLFREAGFSSVYECFLPAHLNFGKPGMEFQDRFTFVAIKDDPCALKTSPLTSHLQETWPETIAPNQPPK